MLCLLKSLTLYVDNFLWYIKTVTDFLQAPVVVSGVSQGTDRFGGTVSRWKSSLCGTWLIQSFFEWTSSAVDAAAGSHQCGIYTVYAVSQNFHLFGELLGFIENDWFENWEEHIYGHLVVQWGVNSHFLSLPILV